VALVTECARRLAPNRRVVRDVQGVSLLLPWSHRLPDFADRHPTYGRNLVAVAEAIASCTPGRWTMVDVGANVGDSALQVLARVDADVLCVEGDPRWLEYLRFNVAFDQRISIEPSLVVVDGSNAVLTPVRSHGTTTFLPGGPGRNASIRQVLADELPARHTGLAPVRLVKSDTDGFDTRIVPGLAGAWRDDRPALFFEYDPALSRAAGDPDPSAVWTGLADLGYTDVGVWNNRGEAMMWLDIGAVQGAETVLDLPQGRRGYHYWDVCVVGPDDPARGAIHDLVERSG